MIDWLIGKKSGGNDETPADRAARRTANATIALAFLTLILAAVSTWTLFEIHEGGIDTHNLAEAARDQANRTRDLADQMKQQADLTRTIADQATIQANAANLLATVTSKQFLSSQQLIESQRAFITVDFLRVAQPVTFNNGSFGTAFFIPLRNNGPIRAEKVSVRFKASFIKWGGVFSEPSKRQAELCSAPIKRDGYIKEITLLPGTSENWDFNFAVAGPSSDNIIVWPPDEAVQTKRVFPIVVGCVDYQSGVMPKPHQTGFIFEIEKKSTDGPNIPTLITLGQDVPRDEVIISKHYFSQGAQQ